MELGVPTPSRSPLDRLYSSVSGSQLKSRPRVGSVVPRGEGIMHRYKQNDQNCKRGVTTMYNTLRQLQLRLIVTYRQKGYGTEDILVRNGRTYLLGNALRYPPIITVSSLLEGLPQAFIAPSRVLTQSIPTLGSASYYSRIQRVNKGDNSSSKQKLVAISLIKR